MYSAGSRKNIYKYIFEDSVLNGVLLPLDSKHLKSLFFYNKETKMWEYVYRIYPPKNDKNAKKENICLMK